MASMKLTKRHKISLVVLALGLFGLVVDRVLLLPRSAAGEEVVAVDETSPENVAEEKVATDDSNSVDVDESLSDRLDALWSGRKFDPSSMRDAFSVPAFWGGSAGPSLTSKPDVEGRFVLAHSLSATVVNGERSCARVDARSLMLGEELDGFILVGVDETSASFEANGRTVVLKLRGADNPSSSK